MRSYAKFDTSTLPAAPDLSQESALWSAGVQFIGGIDEAGRGAWAGPVFAAVVVLPPEARMTHVLSGVRDSKQMTPAQRERWASIIKEACLAWGVGCASHQEIDAIGILPATRLAAQRAVECLARPPQHLLLDYLRLPAVHLPQTPLVKGDARCLSIAAASVLAKTARDARLREAEGEYPGYGFARHKGYGTQAHRAALERLGPCSFHRFSYAPVRAAVEQRVK